jgi:hypothetical protein
VRSSRKLRVVGSNQERAPACKEPGSLGGLPALYQQGKGVASREIQIYKHQHMQIRNRTLCERDILHRSASQKKAGGEAIQIERTILGIRKKRGERMIEMGDDLHTYHCTVALKRGGRRSCVPLDVREGWWTD